MNQNKTLVYVLGGIVVALLLALVGVLAYNYGKSDSSNDDVSSRVDTVVVEKRQAAPMTSAAPMAEPEPEPQVNPLSLNDWHLTGTIAGKSVVMDLYNNNGVLTGSYYYAKYKPSSTLQLNGSVDANGNLYLSEFNTNNGYESGFLEGRMSRSGNLTGHFTNYRGNTYRVNLHLN